MTVSQTPRLGLNKWSAGTDPFTRAQANADADALEAVVGVMLQGLFASRPAPGTQRRMYWATDRAKLYFDDGSAWTEVSPLKSGDVFMSAAAAVPAGALEMNGAAVSRTTYAELYAALGGAASPWGQGDGTTTFNLPNLVNRLPWGAGAPALGVAAAIGSHNHADSGHSHTNTLAVTANNFSTGGKSTGGADHWHNVAGTSGGSNSGNHTHDYPDYGGEDGGIWRTTTGWSNDHSHSFNVNSGNGGVDHSHNANHGHAMSGGVSTGNAAISTVTAGLTGVGLRFLIKT